MSEQTSNQPQSTPVNPQRPPVSKKKSRSYNIGNNKTVLWLVVLVFLVITAVAAGYYYNQYQDSQKEVKRLSNPQQVAQDQAQQLINQIGKLTDLPKGETPTVATVSDVTKLAGQPFFVAAKNGDRVLIYTQNKKAVLYRPSTNKIINIAPVNIGENATTPAPTQ